MRRHIAALAPLAGLASPVPASAQMAIIDYVNTAAVPGNNNFQADLAGLGYTEYTTTGADITLTGNSIIDFFFLGSESGYFDTFSGPLGLTFTEMSAFEIDNFAAPVYIGSRLFASGSLAGLISFSSNQGVAAGVGDDGFGIYVNQPSGTAVSSFILGYDDYVNNADDNHDDLIILARVRNAVPEPGTWAMLLVGFGALGAAMRRKTNALRIRLA